MLRDRAAAAWCSVNADRSASTTGATCRVPDRCSQRRCNLRLARKPVTAIGRQNHSGRMASVVSSSVSSSARWVLAFGSS